MYAESKMFEMMSEDEMQGVGGGNVTEKLISALIWLVGLPIAVV